MLLTKLIKTSKTSAISDIWLSASFWLRFRQQNETSLTLMTRTQCVLESPACKMNKDYGYIFENILLFGIDLQLM